MFLTCGRCSKVASLRLLLYCFLSSICFPFPSYRSHYDYCCRYYCEYCFYYCDHYIVVGACRKQSPTCQSRPLPMGTAKQWRTTPVNILPIFHTYQVAEERSLWGVVPARLRYAPRCASEALTGGRRLHAATRKQLQYW